MILSFAHTTSALLAGRKTVTRRDWKPEHAAKFHAGMLVDAWNTTPRNVRGNPHKVAMIRLTQDPTLEYTADAPARDWEAEGFAYLEEHGLTVMRHTPRDLWESWRERDYGIRLWVVRFELVSVEEDINDGV